mmetsp:Transcript_63473/g.182201  ORF Transcript_63473/g.182201 Transcript_63473/m.182201 type:complete len:337 (-) Transcript_63473:171-1181(-)
MLTSDQLPYVLASVVLMTLQPLLVTLSQNADGKLDYNPVSSTLLTELMKIGISACMLRLETQRSPIRPDPQEALRFAVPAAIYFVNNNLVFFTLLYINATTWQLLSQLKTVFTGLLFRFFLGRKLSGMQYLAIWQLACGTATSHIPKCISSGPDSSAEASNSFWGLILTVIGCMLSALGGIYSEKLLKDKAKDSIHWQNIQLYSWGILFNLIGTIVNDVQVFERGPLAGYNFCAFAVVLNNALNGLAISAILKYADNIVRVYAHAVAMIVTMVLSVLLFGESPTPQLVLAVMVVGASALQYNMPPEQLVNMPKPQTPAGDIPDRTEKGEELVRLRA